MLCRQFESRPVGSQTAKKLFSGIVCASNACVDFIVWSNSIPKSVDISEAYRHLRFAGPTYRSGLNRKQPPTAISGSSPDRSASEAANFLSGHESVVNNVHFTGDLARKTTTMRRTNRLQIRSVRTLSARFLRAMIGEWLFPMHTAKMLAHLHRTELLKAPAQNLTLREAENLFATRRCTATSIAPANSNLG
jgi:hypothetical protein